jgi:sigma-B regulation protein RsbU (phosphoserine phosphatase)
MFVTVFYAILNTKTGLVTYSNAGHNSPHILRADGTIEQLPMDGQFMVGIFPEEEYADKTLQLEHGDTLVMFTDGVTEATDSDGMLFGSERLDNILRREGVRREGVRSQEIVEAVKAGIADFVKDAEQSDDITLLVVKRI